jgi:cytochrome c-type biogenesis protein CcmF
LKPGEEVRIGEYVVRHNSLAVTDDGRKQMVTADMTVLRNGVELTKMYPARWFFRKHEDQPTTEVAIRRALAEDLYIVMPQFDAAQQSANIEITVNPLVNWVWIGFGLLAFGTLIALLPETAFAFAIGRVPDAAKTATASLLLLAIVLPAAVQAQDGAPGVGKTTMQRDIEGKVICMCGSQGCVRSPLNNCPMRPACHGYDAQTAQLRKYLDEGKGQDDILTSFVKEYGTAVLAIPQGGFNSLSWLLPYGIAGLGLLLLVVTARRWSARPAAAGAGGVDTLDPAIDARLDDELRDLD